MDKSISFSRLISLKNDSGHGLVTLATKVPAIFERLVNHGIVSVDELSKIVVEYKSKSDDFNQVFLLKEVLLRYEMMGGKSLLTKWFKEGKLSTDYLLSMDTKTAKNDYPLIQHFAYCCPDKLTRFLDETDDKTSSLVTQQVSNVAPATTVLAIYHPDELFKWIADLEWLSIEDCYRIGKGLFTHSTARMYKAEHHRLLEDAVQDFVDSKVE